MGDYDSYVVPDANLLNIVQLESLKWIFVGGKGGVGKTTTSCSLGIQVRKSVLIISTDPAHNLSDAFKQKFSPNPTAVEGIPNLFCMEMDSSVLKDFSSNFADPSMSDPGLMSSLSSILNDLMASIPGIDEAMSFSELMRQVQSMDYSTIVFDTAPTGHTLRLLSFPSLIEKATEKLNTTSLFERMQQMMGGSKENVTNKLHDMQEMIKKVSDTFKNPKLTTFICVCIPEFLSVYETERLVQELSKNGMDTHNIVVNQVLFPEKTSKCHKCLARQRMQSKYIDQIYDLYEGFHVVMMPLQDDEVRGSEMIAKFSSMLMNAYDPSK